jgi:hypothetical protein
VIDLPTTRAEVQTLIDTDVQEDLHLDYKDSRALDRNKKDEIAKDVSSFANADGGIIIYGVKEANHVPVKIDEGVDHRKLSHEWLEQVIRSNITPRIDELRIVPIRLTKDKSIYVVYIPKSYGSPHQEKNSKKYYKRYNFLSEPMDDYEINDIRTRRQVFPPLINIDTEIKRGVIVYLRVMNIGELPARDVTFEFSDNLIWRSRKVPRLFMEGVKYFPPGKTFPFLYHSVLNIFEKDSKILSAFDITAHYFHPQANQRISDVFYIDMMDYYDSSVIESEIDRHGKIMKDVLEKLTNEIKTLNNHMDKVSSISRATGLNLSVTTLRNLRHLLLNEEQLEKIDPSNPSDCNYSVIQEILAVDLNLAGELEDFFRRREQGQRLSDVRGVTEELVEKIRRHFLIEEDVG